MARYVADTNDNCYVHKQFAINLLKSRGGREGEVPLTISFTEHLIYDLLTMMRSSPCPLTLVLLL